MKGLLYSITFSSMIGAAALATAQVGVDGVLGGEWALFTATHVNFNASALTSNFGAPTNENHLVAYDIYFRADDDYIYGLAQALPGEGGSTYGGGLSFWNVYFDTNPSTGSDVGVEITNNRAFIPNDGTYFSMSSYLTFATNNAASGVVEFAISKSFFTTDPLGMGFGTVGDGGSLQLRLSQAFGYSVAGGATYGNTRLGQVNFTPVPEPATMALMGVGAFAAFRRRFAKKSA